MKRALFIAMTIAALCVQFGCASFNSTISEEASGTKSTKVSVKTFWDSKSSLTKMGAGQTKTSQRVSVEGLQEESSATNVVSITEAIVGAAIRAATKP